MDFIPQSIGFNIFLTIFLGICFGSFSSVLIYRIPRDLPIITFKKAQKKNYNFSFCPNCKNKLDIFDLIPILSWVFQKGQCRHCNKRISIQYPMIEILTACLTVLAWCVFGFTFQGIIAMAMAPILVALLMIDLQVRLLPNILNLSLFLGGVVFHLVAGWGNVWFYLLAALIYPVSMLFIRWIFLKMTGKDGLGLGDVKFFAAAGIWLGLDLFSVFLLASSVFGIVFGLIHKLITKDEMFPFGPALIVSFLICFYAQDWILQFV